MWACSTTNLLQLSRLLPPLDWTPLPVDVYPSEFIIFVEDIETALLSSKLHSVADPDEISAWFLRENASTLCRSLSSIFNLSLRQVIDSDFRPISLTAIISKILQSFPYRWLFQSIIRQINPLQFGALRGSSASMALVHLLHKWYEICDDLGSSLRIYLSDFLKVFDRIDHNVLLKKLQHIIWPYTKFSTSCLIDYGGQRLVRIG